MIITFDLFSAATDARSGAGATFEDIAAGRGWLLDGPTIYDIWDRHNKALQSGAQPSSSFVEISLQALRLAYTDLGLDTCLAEPDLAQLHESVGNWPLWPDVEEGMRTLARHARMGLLSNVDDHLARRTRAAALVDPDLLLTSQRLGAYKPDPAIYRAAIAAVAPEPLVHVAASARDVRGALEAGIQVVRLVRPGHVVDPEGPQPSFEVSDARDLAATIGLLG